MDKQNKEFFGFMFGIIGLMLGMGVVIWFFTNAFK